MLRESKYVHLKGTHVFVLLLSVLSCRVSGLYFPDSKVLARDGVTVDADVTIAPVFLFINGEAIEFSCPFPCNVARAVSFFCRSQDTFDTEDIIGECIRTTWKAHALAEHMLGLREGIKQMNMEKGIHRSNNWYLLSCASKLFAIFCFLW